MACAHVGLVGASLCVSLGCNAVWGLDALDYGSRGGAPSSGSTSSGGGTGGLVTGGTAGGAGDGGAGGLPTGGGGSGGSGGEGAGPCVLGPFNPPTNVAEVNSSNSDSHPWLTADGLGLYFASNRPGLTSAPKLWVAFRSVPSGPFGVPEVLPAAVNSSGTDVRPSLSADGLELYFASDRTGTLGGADLWLATRPSPESSFGAPSHLTALSSTADDWDPGLSPDGLALYFTSLRPGGAPAEVWVSTRSSAGAAFGPPVLVPSVNSTATEAQPWISADGLRLYFGSSRPGGSGLEDIWVASRPSTASSFATAQPVTELNTANNDWGPSLSLDERTLFFYSDRAGGLGQFDIWQATRACIAP